MGLRVTKRQIEQVKELGAKEPGARPTKEQGKIQPRGAAQPNAHTAIWSGLAGAALVAAAGALPTTAAEPTPLTDSTLPGVAAPYCPDQTQQGLNRCATLWVKTAEYLETLVYSDLHQSLELAERVQLAIAEEHWRAFRQAQCDVESDLFQDGSIYSLIHGSCMAQLTNDRTGDLQQWGDAELPAATAEASLQGLLAQQNLADSEPQKLWEAYRNLHCDFEANYRDDQPEQYRQCVSRLTQTRILRLQALADLLDN